MDLALNNQQRLICHKTHQTKPIRLPPISYWRVYMTFQSINQLIKQTIHFIYLKINCIILTNVVCLSHSPPHKSTGTSCINFLFRSFRRFHSLGIVIFKSKSLELSQVHLWNYSELNMSFRASYRIHLLWINIFLVVGSTYYFYLLIFINVVISCNKKSITLIINIFLIFILNYSIPGFINANTVNIIPSTSAKDTIRKLC